jgi:hypothetical protein
MKVQLRSAVMLAMILAMVLVYLGGTVVSAQPSPLLKNASAPTLTNAQWAAIAAASSLLLEGEDGTTTYIPVVLRW